MDTGQEWDDFFGFYSHWWQKGRFLLLLWFPDLTDKRRKNGVPRSYDVGRAALDAAVHLSRKTTLKKQKKIQFTFALLIHTLDKVFVRVWWHHDAEKWIFAIKGVKKGRFFTVMDVRFSLKKMHCVWDYGEFAEDLRLREGVGKDGTSDVGFALHKQENTTRSSSKYNIRRRNY